jgi:hypothetical protein
MSFYRIGLAAVTGLFATVMAQAAFAGCGGCGGYAVTYAYPAAQLVYAAPPVQPVVLAVPAPVIPIAPAPIAVNNWDTNGWGAWGGCGCGGCGCGGGAGLVAYAQPVAPGPSYYVVNQGPEYSGPGFMIPYGSWSPQADLAVPGEYPYVGGYGYRHRYGMYPRYAYHHRWHHYGYGYPLRARD